MRKTAPSEEDLVRVGPPTHGSEKTVGSRPYGFAWAKVRREVVFDSRLKHLDVRIYCALTISRKQQFVSVGQRLMARNIHADTHSIADAMARLVKCGYLKNEPVVNGARAQYRLTDPGLIASKKATLKKSQPPAVCSKCGAICRSLGKSGVCRGCRSTDKTERIARRVAREEISKSA